MSHLDDDTIAIAAIGETLDQADSDHLASCEHCRTELASLSYVVTAARAGRDAEPLEAPPPEVWARIAAETGVDPGLLPASLDARRSARDQDRDQTSGSAVDRERPGSRRTAFLVAASVVGLLLGVGATLAWQALSGDDPAVVASAELAPLPDKIGTGEAEVVQTSSGRELELTLDTALPADAFLQVWLLSPDASLMVPVGVIAGSTGHWALPPDVTLADYPVVDVSVEPYDGNPAHSSDSVVRGTLDLSAGALGAID